MQISFFIARRYLKKRGNTTLIYRLSRLSCYSMSLATAILVFVLSTMNGMEKLLSALFYTYTPALKIESQRGKTFFSDKKLKKRISDLSSVKAIVEILETTAMVRLHRQQAIATIKGVSSNFSTSDFCSNCTRIDSGPFFEDNFSQVNIGILLAQFLQWNPNNSRVEVFYPKQGAHHLNNPYKRVTLEVDGRFSIAQQIDRKYIIAPIDFVERLIDGYRKRTYWEVVIKDQAYLASTQASIKKLLPDGYKVSNREEQNATRRRAIFIERLSICFIFALVLLLASLHIFFMLCMLILEKRKDIATLTALGATPGQIGKAFFYNALLVSLEGILYGLIVGCLLGFFQQKFGIITFNKMRSKVPYPIEVHGLDCLYTAFVTTLFSLFAALWPVKRAIQLAKKSIDSTRSVNGLNL